MARAHILARDVTSARTEVAAVDADLGHRAFAVAFWIARTRRHADAAAAVAGAARRARRTRRRRGFAAAATVTAVSDASALSAVSTAGLVSEWRGVSFGARGEAKSTEPNSEKKYAGVFHGFVF